MGARCWVRRWLRRWRRRAGFVCAHLLTSGAFVTSAAHRPPRRPPGHAISSLCHGLQSQTLSRRFPGAWGPSPLATTPRVRRSEVYCHVWWHLVASVVLVSHNTLCSLCLAMPKFLLQHASSNVGNTRIYTWMRPWGDWGAQVVRFCNCSRHRCDAILSDIAWITQNWDVYLLLLQYKLLTTVVEASH
jgi:hypothetical protein